jgi:hypothetical protein
MVDTVFITLNMVNYYSSIIFVEPHGIGAGEQVSYQP